MGKGSKIRPLIMGRTVTGKPIIGGLFKMHDAAGFPFAMSMAQCEEHGWVASVPQFFFDAIKAGWKEESAEQEIREALRFVCRGHDWEMVRKGLRLTEEYLERRAAPAPPPENEG